MRYFCLLRGMTELERENYPSAIQEFKKAISLLLFQHDNIYGENHAIFLDPLALAHFKAGDLEAAREEYERIINLTTGRFWNGDIFAKSFYMLDKIYEEQGDTAKAIEHYEKFFDLWKDFDLCIAEVEDARKRLAGLEKK